MNKHVEKQDCIISRTEANESKIFWKRWEEYKDDLYGICLKMMNGSGEEAKDALATAMLSAWERFNKHAAKIYNLKGWLIRLTRNVCIDILRKDRKEAAYKEDKEKIDTLNEKTDNGIICIESTEETLLREELLEDIYNSIKKLPMPIRGPAVLRFFLRMPYREIARHCNISTANARKRIQLARATLFNTFRDAGNPPFFFFKKKNTKITHFSPTWGEISREVDRIFNREFHELNGTYAASNLVRLTLPSGVEMSKQIFFNVNLNRQCTRMKTLQDYVNCHPSGWKKRMELAKLLYVIGNWDQAIEEFRQVLKRHPQFLEAWFYLGEIFMDIQQEKKAVIILEKATAFARKEATKHHIKGMIELCHRRVESALTAFTQALTLEKKNGAHWQKLAKLYMLADRPVECLEALEKALKISPRDLLALTHSFDYLVLTGQLEKAEQCVDRVLEIYPHDILALKRKVDQRCFRGLTWNEEGKNTRKLFRLMKQQVPWAAEVHESQSIYYFHRGEFRKGLELLKNFTRKRENQPYGWYYYGCWLYRAGYFQLAAKAVIRAFELYRKDPLLYHYIFKILAHAGIKDVLKIVIREMLKRFPEQWGICSSASLALAAVVSEINQACELSARGVEFQPLLPEAYFRRGRVLEAAGKPGPAIDILLEGWLLLPEGDGGSQSTPAAWLLARIFKTLKDKKQARAWWEEVVCRGAKLKNFFPAQGYYWEGKALHQLGDIDGATRAFRKALSYQLFYPFRSDAKSILKCCCRRGKE